MEKGWVLKGMAKGGYRDNKGRRAGGIWELKVFQGLFYVFY